MGSVDEMLPKDMMEAIQILLFMASALIMISITNTWLLIPIVCMILLFLFLLTIYLRSAQDIKRLEGISELKLLKYINTYSYYSLWICFSEESGVFACEFNYQRDSHHQVFQCSIEIDKRIRYVPRFAHCFVVSIFVKSGDFWFLVRFDGHFVCQLRHVFVHIFSKW